MSIRVNNAFEEINTGHVHSSAKEMNTEVKVFDMVESKQPMSIKTEQLDEDVEYPGQDKKTPCPQIVPSLLMQEYSQMEMTMCGNMDFMFVKQELSVVNCEDKSHTFSQMVGMMNCSRDLKTNGHNNIESRIIQNNHETLQEHANCGHISENVSSMFGVNTKDSLTEKNCQLQTNLGMKTLNNAYISDICNSAVSAVSILDSKYTEEKPHKCDDCGGYFNEAGKLKTHKRIHTGERPYKCDSCGAFFTQAGHLMRHKRTHTGERPYMCESCGASFTEAGSLKTHKRIHTGERPYKCDACGSSFTQNGDLTAHKRTHTGERPYKCDSCGASFARDNHLKTHKRTHTEERPYKCDACDASFACANHLKTHKRTHTGERPYKCDACGACFTQSGSLKRHKRTHTGERPY